MKAASEAATINMFGAIDDAVAAREELEKLQQQFKKRRGTLDKELAELQKVPRPPCSPPCTNGLQ
jgi:hypothetical protein